MFKCHVFTEGKMWQVQVLSKLFKLCGGCKQYQLASSMLVVTNQLEQVVFLAKLTGPASLGGVGRNLNQGQEDHKDMKRCWCFHGGRIAEIWQRRENMKGLDNDVLQELASGWKQMILLQVSCKGHMKNWLMIMEKKTIHRTPSNDLN